MTVRQHFESPQRGTRHRKGYLAVHRFGLRVPDVAE
jgi:hypothetical protein